MMSDPKEREEKPAFPAEGVSLDGAAEGGFDSSLRAGEGPADESLETEESEEGKPPREAEPADTDRLGLPRGGLVAFRKSGGLRFTSRGFVVYRTGWVVPLEGTAGRPRHMTSEALQALEALLLRSRLSRTYRKAKGTPDGYTYEITARYGGHTRYAEVVDGAIPKEQARLIVVLQRLMPPPPVTP